MSAIDCRTQVSGAANNGRALETGVIQHGDRAREKGGDGPDFDRRTGWGSGLRAAPGAAGDRPRRYAAAHGPAAGGRHRAAAGQSADAVRDAAVAAAGPRLLQAPDRGRRRPRCRDPAGQRGFARPYRGAEGGGPGDRARHRRRRADGAAGAPALPRLRPGGGERRGAQPQGRDQGGPAQGALSAGLRLCGRFRGRPAGLGGGPAGDRGGSPRRRAPRREGARQAGGGVSRRLAVPSAAQGPAPAPMGQERPRVPASRPRWPGRGGAGLGQRGPGIPGARAGCLGELPAQRPPRPVPRPRPLVEARAPTVPPPWPIPRG